MVKIRKNMALRYRPHFFGEVVGQDTAVKVMKKLVSQPDIRVIMLSGQHGIGKCLSGNTRFLTPNGWVRLGSLHTSEAPCHSRSINLSVESFPKESVATEFYYHGRSVGIRISFSDGTRLSGLGTHPIMVCNPVNQSFEWKILSEIAEDPTALSVPIMGRNFVFESFQMDSKYYFMGFGARTLIEDGVLCVEAPKSFLTRLVEEFDISDSKVSHKTGNIFSLKSKSLALRVNSSGVEESDRVSVVYSEGEDEVLVSTPEQQWSFICGYFDGGASNYKYFRSYDLQTLRVLKILFLSFGIHSTIRKSSGFSGWYLDIEQYSLWKSGLSFGDINPNTVSPDLVSLNCSSKTVVTSALRDVFLRAGSSFQKSLVEKKLLHLEAERLRSKMDEEGMATVQSHLNMNFVSIRQCIKSSSLDMYDLSVPDVHNFITEGVISHNTTLARLYAKAINCQSRKDGDACGECPPCVASDEGRLSDYSERDCGSSGGVEHVRKLQEEVNFKPAWNYRVFTMDEAHSLTKEASNALLKTLEEPPSCASFLLCTTEPRRVAYPIASRCLMLELDPIRPEIVAERLTDASVKENIYLDKQAALAIARATHGSLRDAFMILERVSILSDGKITVAALAGENWFISANQVLAFIKCLVSRDYKTFQFVQDALTGRNSFIALVQAAIERVCDSAISKKETNTKTVTLIDALWVAYIRLKRTADPIVVMKGLWVDTQKIAELK